MSLESAICPVCQESHLRQANGLMSIHNDSTGVRCAGSQPPIQGRSAADEPPRRVGTLPPPRPQRRRNDPVPEDTEFQRAVEVANEKRYGRLGGGQSSDRPFDPKIYAVGPQRKLNGGAPGSGKR